MRARLRQRLPLILPATRFCRACADVVPAVAARAPGRGSHIATGSFMVAPQAQGRGVGRLLGRHVVEWCRQTGFRGIQFNAVVETNTAAVRLWQSLGFTIIGTVPGAFRHPDDGYVGLHVMFMPLTER